MVSLDLSHTHALPRKKSSAHAFNMKKKRLTGKSVLKNNQQLDTQPCLYRLGPCKKSHRFRPFDACACILSIPACFIIFKSMHVINSLQI